MQNYETVNTPSSGSFSIEEILKTSWDKTNGRKGALLGAVALSFLVSMVFGLAISALEDGSFISVILNIASFAVSAVLGGGIVLMGIRSARGEDINPTMVFDAIPQAVPLVVMTAIVWILTFIGFIFLIIPGVYLFVSYYLAQPFLLDSKLSIFKAMEASRKLVSRRWFTYFVLLLVMGLILIVSALPLGLGLIWTLPWAYTLMGEVYTRAVDSSRVNSEKSFHL